MEEFEVILVRYKGETGLSAHWSLLVCHITQSGVGNNYEVRMRDSPLTPRWELRFDEDFDIAEHWDVQDHVRLSYFHDPAELQDIIRRARLPDMKTENCQDWVRRVVKTAVAADIMPKRALETLQKVPILC